MFPHSKKYSTNQERRGVKGFSGISSNSPLDGPKPRSKNDFNFPLLTSVPFYFFIKKVWKEPLAPSTSSAASELLSLAILPLFCSAAAFFSQRFVPIFFSVGAFLLSAQDPFPMGTLPPQLYSHSLPPSPWFPPSLIDNLPQYPFSTDDGFSRQFSVGQFQADKPDVFLDSLVFSA